MNLLSPFSSEEPTENLEARRVRVQKAAIEGGVVCSADDGPSTYVTDGFTSKGGPRV